LHVLLQRPAEVQLTLQFAMPAQVGEQTVAPMQSKVHVLPLAQLASQLCARLQTTSQVHVCGQASVQSPPAGHVVAEQIPDEHFSPTVHAMPSSQGVPSGTSVTWQAPRASAHAPTWHASLMLEQLSDTPPVQLPATQCSPCVQDV
jgi:hypothetical protein